METLLDELIDASPRVSFGDGVTLFCQGYLLVKFTLRTNTHKSATLGKHDMIVSRVLAEQRRAVAQLANNIAATIRAWSASIRQRGADHFRQFGFAVRFR